MACENTGEEHMKGKKAAADGSFYSGNCNPDGGDQLLGYTGQSGPVGVGSAESETGRREYQDFYHCGG